MLSLSEEGINPYGLYKLLFEEEIYIVKEKEGQYVAPVSEQVAVKAPIAEESEIKEKPVQEPEPANNVEEPLWSAEGNPEADVLVLFHYSGGSIPDEEKELLSKILIAARLDYEKIARSNIAEYPNLGWADIAHLTPASVIFTFGVPHAFLPEELEEGKMFTNSNKTIVRNASLAAMATDNNLKKALWQLLKEIYQL